MARCLRSLGRHREALETQRNLEAEHVAAETTDGYVFEEIAENLWSLGEHPEARTYFAKAVDELGKDDWFVKNEAKRFESLVERARES